MDKWEKEMKLVLFCLFAVLWEYKVRYNFFSCTVNSWSALQNGMFCTAWYKTMHFKQIRSTELNSEWTELGH